MAKNLVVCCDGTNNEVAGDQTNVLRVFRTLVRSPEQEIFYDAGVGTKADPTALWPWSRYLRKTFDAAVGQSIRAHVVDAYRFLMAQYNEGDRVYLFGFSRGAYTVRALAGLINRCGLLHTHAGHLAEHAWSVYSDEDRSGDRSRMFGGSARIKKVFGRKVEIHFLGTWDTVSSFGWFWDQLTLPDTRTNEIVRHVRHAVSIDEKRAFFRPNRFQPPEGQDCKEVWFPGVHADVGGGYRAKDAGLAKISFRWMLGEAKALGLRVDDNHERQMLDDFGDPNVPDERANQHNEAFRPLWLFAALLPRYAYSGYWKRRIPWWPNLPSRRRIEEGAEIHRSVHLRMQDSVLKYRPRLPAAYTFVDNCHKPAEVGDP